MILGVSSLKQFILFRFPVLMLVAALLAGCQTLGDDGNWPADVPDRQQFLTVYQADMENQQRQTQQQYLGWVIRFYQGWELMSTGWNELTPAVLMGMSGDTLVMAREESQQLGVAISSEWAKDNSVRQINTAMLSLWGTVMLSMEEPEERLVALRQISDDVEAIMHGELTAEDITDERYMRLLELPEFF